LISAANITITDLRVQNAKEPLAIEDKHPVFSWKMTSDQRGARQESYRIRVFRDSDGSMVWDSEEVNDGHSDNISYAGVALQPDMSYSWELTVKDNKGEIHTEHSRFETGLMNPRISAWKGAKWVGGPELKLDATSQSVFGISSKFKIVNGGTASFIFGADDFRLRSSFFNDSGVASKENYIKLEIEPNKNEVRIYRVGYFPDDTPLQAIHVLNPQTCPRQS